MIRSKVKVLSAGQHFLHYKSMGIFRRSRASNSAVNSPILPEIKISRDCMAVLVTCKYDEDLTKNEVDILRARLNMGVLGTKGQVSPKRIFRSGPNSNFPEIICLSYLSASLMKTRSKPKALSIGQGQIWALND